MTHATSVGNNSGLCSSGLKPRKLRTVAVIGGGLMGSGIATALVLAGTGRDMNIN